MFASMFILYLSSHRNTIILGVLALSQSGQVSGALLQVILFEVKCNDGYNITDTHGIDIFPKKINAIRISFLCTHVKYSCEQSGHLKNEKLYRPLEFFYVFACTKLSFELT